ncbi:MAG TPA: NTP transferase domain-containing protein, partial [Planctomycetota bacterium]|nr:NTP transferase domain-containing protein [Planctomycetota bacterium]
MASSKGFAVVIMAAGQGKRMNSDLPKVLHPLQGKPLVEWVINAARAAGAGKIVVIVGHGKEQVIKALPPGVEHAVQDKQLGTGHAVKCAEPQLKDWKGPIVVLSGDVPLIRPATIRQLIGKQQELNAAAVVLTGKVTGDHAYGRIIRDESGSVKGIVEHKDATPEQKKINEINSGTYAFGPGKLFTALAQIRNDNAQGEFYLTDTIGLYVKNGQLVSAVRAPSAHEFLGINTPQELAAAEAAVRDRKPSASASSADNESTAESSVQIAMEMFKNMRIFTGNANQKLAEDICAYLGIPLGDAEVSHFPDGETKVRIR